ncbi:MAG TPA: ImmA/IrrE family metallo-endopeptidase [Chryseolinea sp.]
MIPDHRKNSLNKLATFVGNGFSENHVIQLGKIAKSERIFFHNDHYENYFDGMLVCDNDDDFHIHLNLDRGNTEQSRRGRFSFAHELAHYFIDEHRIPLLSGQAAPHGSLHDFAHRDEVEEEADYFAGCLLMPDAALRKVPVPRRFSVDTIIKLSDAFNTSVLSTVLRFAESGTHEICAVISENNVTKWYTRSKDFPDWPIRFKVGHTLPPSTVAGEFYTKRDAKYKTVEDVDPGDWFFPRWTPTAQMHEQCYYSDSYGYVISLLWFD